MIDTGETRKTRRGLLIAGLVVVLIAVAGMVHFVFSGARAGFPTEMIARGRSWIFIGGHAILGLVGLILLGLARTRAKPGAPRPLEPVASTRVVSKVVEDVGAGDDGPPSLPAGATEGARR